MTMAFYNMLHNDALRFIVSRGVMLDGVEA